MKAILLATIAAIAIQPIVFIVLFMLPMQVMGAGIPASDFFGFPLFAALFSAPFVVAIGIPSLLLLRHFNRLSWLSLGSIGFIAAAIPFAIYGWSDYSGYSSGGNWYGTPVDFVINGQKTLYGWLNYAQSILFFGLHGLAGALVFFFVWRRGLGPNNSFKPKPLRGSA
jgi:hypothetical protein